MSPNMVISENEKRVEGGANAARRQAESALPRQSARERAGFSNDFTRRNLTFMTFNPMHMARMPKDAGGLPAHGNQVSH